MEPGYRSGLARYVFIIAVQKNFSTARTALGVIVARWFWGWWFDGGGLWERSGVDVGWAGSTQGLPELRCSRVWLRPEAKDCPHRRGWDLRTPNPQPRCEFAVGLGAAARWPVGSERSGEADESGRIGRKCRPDPRSRLSLAHPMIPFRFRIV